MQHGFYRIGWEYQDFKVTAGGTAKQGGVMERSDQLGELLTALSIFQGKMKAVAFDSNNPFFKSKYASLSALVSAAAPVVSECGLSVVQLACDDGAITTVLGHKSGQFIGSTLRLKPVKEDPQGVGSAITYARRYAYAAILGLVSDEDDDGNHASQPKAETAKVTTAQASDLLDMLVEIDEQKNEAKVAGHFGVKSLEDLPANKFKEAEALILARGAKKAGVLCKS